ncbi:hypothetical protein ACSBR2_013142 [Camellia fascicularis]
MRHLRLGTGDAEAILTYFTKMQNKNSSFFYVMDLDDDGRFKNVFWADARGRAAYESFGDVVSFDSTYLTNKYDMPFAPFVGVNHLGQSILFGCGLLSNENIRTLIFGYFNRGWHASLGMSTTQRSESMNAFFDGYVNSKTTLKQFVEQYDNALRSKVEKGNQVDHAYFHFRIPLITKFDIEKQFQEIYTMAKFKEFQDELRGLIYCNISFVKQEGCIFTFEVEDSVKVGDSRKEVNFSLYYNEKECEVHCLCHLFEFRGILCRHAIVVLNKNKVKKVPSRYILSRWRKDLRHRHSFIKCSYNDQETNEQVQQYDKLCSYFYEIAKIAAESEEKCNHLMSCLSEIKEKMQKTDDQLIESQCPSLSPCNEEFNGMSKPCTKVLSPLPVRAKGRPPSKRKESKIDQLVRKQKVEFFKSYIQVAMEGERF